MGGPRDPLDLSQPIIISLQELWVHLMVGNKLIDFLVDTEAPYSVLNNKDNQEKLGCGDGYWSDCTITKWVFLQPLECQLEGQKLMYSFLYMPNFPIPLLG